MKYPGPGTVVVSSDPRRQQCRDIFAAKDNLVHPTEPVWDMIARVAGAENCRDFNDHSNTIEKQLKHLLLYNLLESLVPALIENWF